MSTSKKVVITGGPGTGKTSVINTLDEMGHICFPEISRQVTLEAREKGIEQLFLTNSLLFSEKLLEGRQRQFHEAEKQDSDIVFMDRGLPDVLAYMDYIGDDYPYSFVQSCKNHIYDQVFLLPPWKDIYVSDAERYEDFKQSQLIYKCLVDTYSTFGYLVTEVPVGEVSHRTDFILNNIDGF